MSTEDETLNVQSLTNAVDALLSDFARDIDDLSLRDKVLRLVDVWTGIRSLGKQVVRQHLDATSARERIRLYLLEYPRTVISGKELEVVSGIVQYARRIRELRVELGYHIASGSSAAELNIELSNDDYFLVSTEPDKTAARRWHLAKRIRGQGGGVRQRILEFLLENVGEPVTTEELAYIAKGASAYPRRIRELRTEFGYSISTRSTGRADLAPGIYVLESAKPIARPHDRIIPDAVRKTVLKRDKNACRSCAWKAADWNVDDQRIIELHHRVAHKHGGENTAPNLFTLCNRCHDEFHAGRMNLDSILGEDA